jgi:hypothetical protein
MSELGHRLLVGREAPHLPADGFRFIRDAAAQREPHALHRLAVLTAGGAFVAQDWNGAFRLLAQAADAGSEDARKQLLAIESIDLTTWFESPAGENLVADGRVVRFARLAPDAVCAWLIERARGRLERARVYDSVNQRETTHAVRGNTAATFDLATVDVVQFLVQARMAAACGMPWRCMESPTILHYDTGEEIREHFDFVDPKSPNYQQLLREQGQRMITFLLYLNDDYTGGDTDFPQLGIRHHGERGAGLYFRNAHPDGRPDARMVHAGRPPERGEKWIVSQFIRSVPLR